MARNSSTIAAPNILFTADASPLIEEIRQTKQEATSASKAFEQGMAQGFKKGANQAQRSATQTATAAKSMSQQFAGAGSAISGATAALQAMDVKGSPAVATVGSAVASLASSGFGPLGIAITAVTTAVGLFVASSQEAEKQTKSLNKELERQKSQFEGVIEAAREARLARLGFTGDTGASRLRVEQAGAREARAQREVERLRGITGGFGAAYEDALKEVKAAEAEVRAANFELAAAMEDSLRNLSRLLGEVNSAPIPAEIDKLMSDERIRELFPRPAEVDASTRSVSELSDAIGDLADQLGEVSQYRLPTPADLQPPGATFGRGAGADAEVQAYVDAIKAQEEADARRAAAADELQRKSFTMDEALGLKPLNNELSRMQELAQNLGETFTDSIGSALASAVLDARDLGDAMQDVTRIVAGTAIQLGVRAALGPALGLPGFATGGSFTVGGVGGTDSQVVAFKASPGEMVDVTRPGDPGKGVTVNVHNYAGAAVSTRSSMGPDGREQIDVMVAEAIERGGRTSQALERRLGTRRLPRSV